MYAIDLFERLRESVAYGAGENYKHYFEANMRSFYADADFLTTITAPSGDLKSADFPKTFSFCHVDGGHSPEETYADLKFVTDILVPGGLAALDDYFNPEHAGVCEGALDFARRHPGVLAPVAVAYNKVLLRKNPSPVNLNQEFVRTFPRVPRLPAGDMWGSPILLFHQPLRSYVDLYGSTPDHLIPIEKAPVRATFQPRAQGVRERPGTRFSLPVVVKNTSNEEFPCGRDVFGLSYHLLSAGGETLRHDNERTYFRKSLAPGSQAEMELRVTAPPESGHYKLEIDLVWEGVMWFKDIGNPAAVVELEVR
jgi:hypothetical protein